jgi:integrase
VKPRGTGSLYMPSRSPNWWIKFYDRRGKCVRESSGSPDRRVAEKLLKKRMGEKEEGRLVGPAGERLTLTDLIELVKQDAKDNGHRSKPPTAQLLKYFGPRARAMEIKPADMKRYIRHRRKEGAAAQTVKNELAVLGRGFNLACEDELLLRRPKLVTIKVANIRTGFFEQADLMAVLPHLPEYLRPFVEFAYITGWRRGELCSLQWRQVDFAAGTVRLEPGKTKNGEGRLFPFAAHPRLAALLAGQRERAQELGRQRQTVLPWVFFREDGRQVKGWYYDAWHSACREAGLPGKLVHDFRRSAVRNLVRSSISEHVAMKLTGHRTRSVFDRYDIVSEGDLAEAVAKLAARQSSRTAEPRKVVALSAAVSAPPGLGTGILAGILPGTVSASVSSATDAWRPQRDSNPCRRRERAVS